MRDHANTIGMHYLETPALLLDTAAMERNLRCMAGCFGPSLSNGGVSQDSVLRAHAARKQPWQTGIAPTAS